MGRPPTHSELEEELEGRYRETPERRLSRTADTEGREELSEESSADSGPEEELPVADPARWQPDSMITSTPAVERDAAMEAPAVRAESDKLAPGEDGPRTGPQPAKVADHWR